MLLAGQVIIDSLLCIPHDQERPTHFAYFHLLLLGGGNFRRYGPSVRFGLLHEGVLFLLQLIAHLHQALGLLDVSSDAGFLGFP